MKTKEMEISLKRPVRVLQVFRNAGMFRKEERAADAGRDMLRWPPKSSMSGYVQQGKLYLPEKSGGYEDMNQYGLVLLLDDMSEDPRRAIWKEERNRYIQPGTTVSLSFLKIRTGNPLEIYLNGAGGEGRPQRGNYKLCELKDQPVEIKINGKADGYHQRYYMEEQFMIASLGGFDRFTILPASATPVMKQVPAAEKLVDLRVLLW